MIETSLLTVSSVIFSNEAFLLIRRAFEPFANWSEKDIVFGNKQIIEEAWVLYNEICKKRI